MAIRLADTARPNNYVDAEHKGTFPVAYAEDIWFEDDTRLSEKSFDDQSIQVEELPTASATEHGHIYQYIGMNGTYINGRFYKCLLNSSVYYWSEIKMGCDPEYYSTSETKTNKVWIDGKPIYRKVFVVTGSYTGTGEVIIGTINNFEQLVNITTITNSNAGSNQEVEFYRCRDSRLSISLNGTATVKMDRLSSYCIGKIIMIVEYTKNTN